MKIIQIILTEQTASLYYDHFQPPTAAEGEVIVVEGNYHCSPVALNL